MKCKSEAFNDWVKGMDQILSETRSVTIDGQPMEASDFHFKDQINKLAKVPLVLDGQAVYPINVWTASDLVHDEIDAINLSEDI
ncbi:MAG TPA: hypothetical protein DCM40_34095 [Maribacter sp.]|nr:hypothetical protein [Maribacter sp.]|tara:strand:- start:197 stop:448 length:252 start_codon:yes stop_codon:yes gene_type:complete